MKTAPFVKHNSWYVITGGPSTGKTTLLAELKKMGYITIPEAARRVIDEAVIKGIAVEDLRADEEKFQQAVARKRIELEATTPKNKVVFLDRGMPDSLAYMRYYAFPIDPIVTKELQRIRYTKVFLMQPLPIYKKDYARTEVLGFSDKITDLLAEAYREYKMEPIFLPAVSVEERLRIVLDHIQQNNA